MEMVRFRVEIGIIKTQRSGEKTPTVLGEFRRAEPGPDSDALLVAPHEAAPERGPVDGEVGLLDVADPGGEGEVVRGVAAAAGEVVGVLALVDAEGVGAILDGRLVGLHQVHEGEPQQLLLTSIFGCWKE